MSLGLVLTIFLHGSGIAQGHMTAGDSVRLRLVPALQAAQPSDWISGTIASAGRDSLWLRVALPGITAAFAAAEVERVEAHRGTAPFGRGKGMLIGAGAGALLGALIGTVSFQGATEGSAEEVWAPASISLLAVVGGLVGGTVGRVLGGRRVPVWEVVSFPSAAP